MVKQRIVSRYSLIQYMPRPDTRELFTLGVLAEPEEEKLPDALVFASDLGMSWKKRLLGEGIEELIESLRQVLEERVLDVGGRGKLFKLAAENLDDRFHLSKALKVYSGATEDALLEALSRYLVGVTAAAKRRDYSQYGRKKLSLTHRVRAWVNHSPFEEILRRGYIFAGGGRLNFRFQYGAIGDNRGLLIDAEPLGYRNALEESRYVAYCAGCMKFIRRAKPGVELTVICGDSLEHREGRQYAGELEKSGVMIAGGYEIPEKGPQYDILRSMHMAA